MKKIMNYALFEEPNNENGSSNCSKTTSTVNHNSCNRPKWRNKKKSGRMG